MISQRYARLSGYDDINFLRYHVLPFSFFLERLFEDAEML